MARSENQGLQIALILFVLLTVALAIATFGFFQSADKARKVATQATADAAEATTSLSTAVAEMRILKGFHKSEQIPLPSGAEPASSVMHAEDQRFMGRRGNVIENPLPPSIPHPSSHLPPQRLGHFAALLQRGARGGNRRRGRRSRAARSRTVRSFSEAVGVSAARVLGKFDGAGDHLIEARLAGNLLDVDNHRWLALPVKEALEVLCVNGRPAGGDFGGATDYLAVALSPEADDERRSLVRCEVVTETALLELDLGRYDCIFLADVAQFTANEALVLQSYVEGQRREDRQRAGAAGGRTKRLK